MENWTKNIDETTDSFVGLFGSLTPEQLNWKPDARTWSIAQNIDHLIVINESYFPVLDSVRNGTNKLPFTARFGLIASIMGKTLLKAVRPDRKRKMKTFPVWEPSHSRLPADILERFQKHQEDLKVHILNSADLIQKGIIISSPANKYIVYRLETAFDIIVIHEQRHLEQAKELLALIQANAGSPGDQDKSIPKNTGF